MTNEYLENAFENWDETITIKLETGSFESGMQEAGFEETDGVAGYLAVYKLIEDDDKLYGVLDYEEGCVDIFVAGDEDELQEKIIEKKVAELEEKFMDEEVTLHELIFYDVDPDKHYIEQQKRHFMHYVKDGVLEFTEPECFDGYNPYGYFADLEVVSTEEEVKEMIASDDILSVVVRVSNIFGEIL